MDVEFYSLAFRSVVSQLNAACLARGLALGDDSGFSQALNEAVAILGIQHLTAASGANLQALQKIVPSRLLCGSFWSRQIMLLGIVLWYCATAGLSGSLWRAMAGWVAVWGLSWLGKPGSSLLLIWVVLATAAFRPVVFPSASFQLSCLAMVGVYLSRLSTSGENKISFSPQSEYIRVYARNAFWTGWIVSICVGIWTWWQWQVWSPRGVLMTMLVSPLVDFSLRASFLSSLSAEVSPPVSLFTALPVYPLLATISLSSLVMTKAGVIVDVIVVIFGGHAVWQTFQRWRDQRQWQSRWGAG